MKSACMSTFAQRATLFSAALLCVLPMTTSAVDQTVTFNVNTTVDAVDDNAGDGLCRTGANSCSLRAAIMQANQTQTNGKVVINVPAGLYRLSIAPAGSNADNSGDLNLATPFDLSQTLEIRGASALTTIIDGNQLDRVMSVQQNRTASIADVTVRNGFLQGGAPTASGGVDNRGSLTLSRCIVEGNRASTSEGGGIVNISVLTVQHSIVRDNVARSGGGIYALGPTTIEASRIERNSAISGGGIANSASVRLVDSTISGNSASTDGGGIFNIGTLTVLSSTLSGNSANTNGGGIENRGNAFVYSASVINNDADHDRDETGGIGGGVHTTASARTVVVNTLVAVNTILDAPITNDCSGTLEVYGRNLFGDLSGCVFTGNGNAARGLVSVGTIGPLRDNGGPTTTHALLVGSEAIDSTTAQGCIADNGALLSTDQRGAPRAAGVRCDVGAFEFGAVVDRIFINGFDGDR
ncbi:MAG: choice-of-anchor Q domain-containing protein [Dokdonella sp.]